MLFFMEHGTVAAKAAEVHTASAHVPLLSVSHSEMKSVEVSCKPGVISAGVAPRPPGTWLRTSRLFLTPQAATPSPPTVPWPPLAALVRLSWPCLVAAGRSLPAPPLPWALPIASPLPPHLLPVLARRCSHLHSYKLLYFWRLFPWVVSGTKSLLKKQELHCAHRSIKTASASLCRSLALHVSTRGGFGSVLNLTPSKSEGQHQLPTAQQGTSGAQTSQAANENPSLGDTS